MGNQSQQEPARGHTLISVVSPVFNESPCLEELYRRLTLTLTALCDSYEILLVDDGSTDDSWLRIADLSRRDPHVRGLRFSRNFGHHLSISAGLDHASGEWIVVMDSDLQDLPESIPDLLAKALEGFDVVLACRKLRRDSLFKRMAAHAFYKTYAFLTDSQYDGQAGVFRIMSRRVAGVLRGMRERNRFFPGMVDWVGFPRSRIFVEHATRYAGETKYPLSKQIALAINTILSFSDKPLIYVMYFGLTLAGLALLYGLAIVILAIFGDIVVLGYASLASAIFFVGGFTIFTIGLVGIYVGRIFRQVQGRPLYVIGERAGSGPPVASAEYAARTPAPDGMPE